MFRNYFKIAIRNLSRHRGYSFINILGLTIGFSCCLLIFIFVRDELVYDQFHQKKDRIFRILDTRIAEDSRRDFAFTPAAMGPALRESFPEVEESVRFFAIGKVLVKQKEKQFFEEHVYAVEPSIFDIFTLSPVHGDWETALVEPYSVVITRRVADKYFETGVNPVGKQLQIDNEDVFTVTGVMEDWPAHSHLNVDMLVSFATTKDWATAERLSSWVWQQFYTYILLHRPEDSQAMEAKLPDFIAANADPQTRPRGFHFNTYLQPLTDIYLHSSGLMFDFSGPRGNIKHVYAFSVIAVFVLLIACFNFMNLSTARSLLRSREIGVRKVVGASRFQLIKQFLSESLFLAITSIALAFGFVEFILPSFNSFTGKTISLSAIEPTTIFLSFGLVLVVGILAGSYPAFFLSNFRPMSVLKNLAVSGIGGHAFFRKILVVGQFAISIFLGIGTIIILQQLDYVRSKDLGFNKEELLILPLRGDMGQQMETIKTELLQHQAITDVAASYGNPGSFVAGDDIRLPGQDGSIPTGMLIVDYDYITTFDMEIVAGRSFSREFGTDADRAFILNESLVENLGWSPQEAIGKEIWWDMWGVDGVKKGQVVGVIKDFHINSLRDEIAPLAIHIYPSTFASLSLRVRPENMSQTIGDIGEIWAAYAPDWPFEFRFLDQTLDAKYKSEQQLSQILGIFSGLAVFVACLGLFGLASFTIEQRTREVGVRKVLGASISNVVGLFTKDFTRLVAGAFLVASPFAYFFVKQWLQDFAYRIDISVWPFLLAGIAGLIIAFLTISYQAVKAALANPVDALRYE